VTRKPATQFFLLDKLGFKHKPVLIRFHPAF
jgi:hypothetical protein